MGRVLGCGRQVHVGDAMMENIGFADGEGGWGEDRRTVLSAGIDRNGFSSPGEGRWSVIGVQIVECGLQVFQICKERTRIPIGVAIYG